MQIAKLQQQLVNQQQSIHHMHKSIQQKDLEEQLDGARKEIEQLHAAEAEYKLEQQHQRTLDEAFKQCKLEISIIEDSHKKALQELSSKIQRLEGELQRKNEENAQMKSKEMGLTQKCDDL